MLYYNSLCNVSVIPANGFFFHLKERRTYYKMVSEKLTVLSFTQGFVDSAYKQLAWSQTRNLLRRNNLSGDLTDDCVNCFMSFYE